MEEPTLRPDMYIAVFGAPFIVAGLLAWLAQRSPRVSRFMEPVARFLGKRCAFLKNEVRWGRVLIAVPVVVGISVALIMIYERALAFLLGVAIVAGGLGGVGALLVRAKELADTEPTTAQEAEDVRASAVDRNLIMALFWGMSVFSINAVFYGLRPYFDEWTPYSAKGLTECLAAHSFFCGLASGLGMVLSIVCMKAIFRSGGHEE